MGRGYQQGDVLLKIVDGLPGGAEKVAPRARGVVVAEGEVTGHAHVFAPDAVTEYLLAGKRYVKVEKPTALVHEEHLAVTVQPGVYEIGGVVEKDWMEDAVRPVVD